MMIAGWFAEITRTGHSVWSSAYLAARPPGCQFLGNSTERDDPLEV